jgi:hypothetical protein
VSVIHSDFDKRLNELNREARETDRESERVKERLAQAQADVVRLKRLSDRVQRKLESA